MDAKAQRTHFADDATLERMVRLEAALREARLALGVYVNAWQHLSCFALDLLKKDGGNVALAARATIDEVLNQEKDG
jgi:hypothetical protein